MGFWCVCLAAYSGHLTSPWLLQMLLMFHVSKRIPETSVLIRCFHLGEQPVAIHPVAQIRNLGVIPETFFLDPLPSPECSLSPCLVIDTFSSPLISTPHRPVIQPVTTAFDGVSFFLTFDQPFHTSILVVMSSPLEQDPIGLLFLSCPLIWPLQSSLACPPQNPQVQLLMRLLWVQHMAPCGVLKHLSSAAAPAPHNPECFCKSCGFFSLSHLQNPFTLHWFNSFLLFSCLEARCPVVKSTDPRPLCGFTSQLCHLLVWASYILSLCQSSSCVKWE